MAPHWDNIEILQPIDRLQTQMGSGAPLGNYNGLTLLQQIDSAAGHEHQSMKGFAQELRIERARIGRVRDRKDPTCDAGRRCWLHGASLPTE